MATYWVNTGATGSGDGSSEANGYTSLAACVAARAGTLTEPQIIICSATGGGADTTAVSLTGYTTDGTNTLTIRSATGAESAISHVAGSAWSTSKYRLSVATDNVTALVPTVNVRLTGLQIEVTGTGTATHGIVSSAAMANLIISGCFVRGTAAGPLGGGIEFATACTGDVIIVNTIVQGAWANSALYNRSASSSAKSLYYHCTVYGGTNGFRARGDYCYAQNCLSIGCTTAYLETAAFATANYCGFDQGSDPGTNGLDLTAVADGDIFVNAAGGDFSLVTGTGRTGVSLSTDPLGYYNVTTDINGATRTAWHVGADEYPEAGGLSAFVAEQQRSTTF